MRIGIFMPLRMGTNYLPDAKQVQEVARRVEDAGLSGIWSLDMLGAPQVQPRPDPLTWLLTACLATDHIEVGTGIYNVANRNPIDVSQRLLTLEALVPRRFTLGVGAGSTKHADDIVGLDFDTRFKRLYENMDIIRRLCRGESVTAPGGFDAAAFNPPPGSTGPRFLLGAWHSDYSLKRVINEFDGWIASGGRTNFATLSESMERYRALGGTKRAIVSGVGVDFSAPEAHLSDDASFSLRGPFEIAKERIGRVAELGYDDILLMPNDTSAENLAKIRELLPVDGRPIE